MRIYVTSLDCGAKIGVAIAIGGKCRGWRFRNPFRIVLSDEDFHAGKPRYRWPVSLFYT